MPENGDRALSIRDVARLAGVSHQTVSRVLNNSPSIKDSTRARVLEVIEQYDYRPNQAARALTTRRSGAIGVLSAPLTLFGPVTSAHAIEVAARAAGYRITTTHVDLADDASVRQGVSWLLSQSIEGLVVIAPHRRVTSILEDIPIGVPRVTLHSPGVDPAHGLSVDQIEGGRLATRHLIDLGHRRILHLAGPDDWLEASARTRGYVAEMEAAGLEAAPPVVGDWTAETGYRIARDLDLGGAGWTAVFTANDQMALGVVHAASERGLAVPDDLSVVGFDDIPEAAHFGPPLTTVRQDFAEVGRRAIAHILAEIQPGGGPVAVTTEESSIAPTLVVRASTAAPA